MHEDRVDSDRTMPYVSSKPVSNKGYDDKQSNRTLPQLLLKEGISSGAAARSWQSYDTSNMHSKQYADYQLATVPER